MGLLDNLFSGNTSGLLIQVISKSGMSQDTLEQISAEIFPIISEKLKTNLFSSDSSGNIVSLISSLDTTRLIEKPDELFEENFLNKGSDILNALLGGENETDQLVSQIAQSASVDEGTLKEILPGFVCSLITAVMSNGLGGLTALLQTQGGGSTDINDIIGSVLGSDGPSTEDLMNQMKKIL